jgi:uncharacterized protein YndB with AHSA1/START domain
MNYQTSIAIDAPPEQVWTVLTDVERWPEWTASMTSVSLIGGAGLAVGSKARIKQPKMPTLVWEVTELEPGQAFTWKAVSAGVTTLAVHRLTTDHQGGVTVSLGVEQRGLLAGLVGLLTGGMTRRYVQMEAEGLKRRCEANVQVSTTGS